MIKFVFAVLAFELLPVTANAACGPEALGTERTLTLKREGAAYGAMQHVALPLEKGEVVLTFDDGPRKETTPMVLKALARECVKATFFMNGHPLSENPNVAKAVAADGHSIGMHGYEHSHFQQMPSAAQLDDLTRMQYVFEKTFGYEAPAYRFPFVEETPTLLRALRDHKVTVMSADVAIDDWLPNQSSEVLAERLIDRLKASGGGIILMHDWQDQTAAAMPALLRALQKNGYKVVHLEWEP